MSTPSLNAVYADWAARGVMPPGAERRVRERRQGKEWIYEDRRKRDRREPPAKQAAPR